MSALRSAESGTRAGAVTFGWAFVECGVCFCAGLLVFCRAVEARFAVVVVFRVEAERGFDAVLDLLERVGLVLRAGVFFAGVFLLVDRVAINSPHDYLC